jgi:hypothetical protein
MRILQFTLAWHVCIYVKNIFTWQYVIFLLCIHKLLCFYEDIALSIVFRDYNLQKAEDIASQTFH